MKNETFFRERMIQESYSFSDLIILQGLHYTDSNSDTYTATTTTRVGFTLAGVELFLLLYAAHYQFMNLF